MSEIQQAAVLYLEHGMRPVRVQAYGKSPISRAWQNSEPSPHQFQPGDNIGIDLGRSGPLVDIDLDFMAARVLAPHPLLFGHLPAFGREHQIPGHRLVLCADAPQKVTRFDLSGSQEKAALNALGLEKSMVLELRAAKGQTVVPPSVYADAEGRRQAIVWERGVLPTDIPAMSWMELQRRASLLAMLSLVASTYPIRGTRDFICLHLAGALVQIGLEPGDADELIVSVARAAGDEEAELRRGKSFASANKANADEPVTGLPTLLRELGLETCEKRVREWLGLTSQPKSNIRPMTAIQADNPAIHLLVQEMADLLKNKSGQVYRRGAALVRLSTLEAPEEADGVYRHAGLVELRVADADWLVHEASRCGGEFVAGDGGKWRRVPPPRRAAVTLAAVADETNFNVVQGLAMTPTLSRDEPGYDPATKLLLTFPAGMFPPIGQSPSKIDAEKALARLEAPISEFPFIDAAARSVALSAMLCGVFRGEMRTCPMHVFDAPAAGSGKSKLSDLVGVLMTGVAPSVISYSSDAEENEKRLATMLRCGDPVIAIDNISHVLEGDFLCQMLTQESVQARILGQSERVRMSTRSLVLATGNNVRFRGDIARRVVVGRIDAKIANPEERKFDFDPVERVKANRASLVADALTVLRAYRAAGMPVEVPPYGSFEDWNFIRGALMWLGRADPGATRERASVENLIVEERAELLAALHKSIGVHNRVTVARMEGHADLAENLARLTDKPGFNRKSIGHLLGRHRDNPLLGLTLKSKQTANKIQEWWLEGAVDMELGESAAEGGEIPF